MILKSLMFLWIIPCLQYININYPENLRHFFIKLKSDTPVIFYHDSFDEDQNSVKKF